MGMMTQNKRMKTAKMSVRKGKGESRNVGTLVDASQYLVLEDHIRSLYGTPHARVCCLQVLRESVGTGSQGKCQDRQAKDQSALPKISMQI